MFCPHCKNQGAVSGKLCIHCTTPENFLKAFEKAIADNEKTNPSFYNKLKLVKSFLPDYPVMAVMEAESLGIRHSVVDAIASVYNVKPFADASYTKLELKGKTNG